MARNRSNQPATAYDLRRCKTLVDVLAMEDYATRYKGLQALATAWDLGRMLKWDTDDITHELAKHAQSHAHEQLESE